MAEDKVKQVIIMRMRYPDGKGGTRKLRTGKLIAQGAHASVAILSKRIREAFDTDGGRSYTSKRQTWAFTSGFEIRDEELMWILGEFTKICLGVDTEEELLAVYEAAKAAGLDAHLIQDCGLTEFDGTPTYTAVGIGPDYASKIDPVTKDLSLI